MSHVVIYVPGLGDRRVTGRRLLVAAWRLYGVRPVVHQMIWADKESFSIKLLQLLHHIDELVEQGNTVSLVGESAGGGAVMNAYAARQDSIHRVACICGKLQRAETIHRYTYSHNPAFAQSMAALPGSLKKLDASHLERVRSIKPLADHTVPPADTVLSGTESVTIPSFGHAASIILGDTLFSWLIVGFLKRP